MGHIISISVSEVIFLRFYYATQIGYFYRFTDWMADDKIITKVLIIN